VLNLPQFEPVQVGPLTLDFSITKHVLFMLIAATGVAVLLIVAARDAQRAEAAGAGRGRRVRRMWWRRWSCSSATRSR
jgi:hypothetical protein